MKHKLRLFPFLSLLIISFSCGDLDVENLNEPDASKALQSPGDVESLIAGSYKTFHNATESWYGPNGLSVMADELTCSWGNAAMKDLSSEPRQAFTNDVSYIDINHVNWPWSVYSAISSVNDGLGAMLDPDNPVEIGTSGMDTQRAIAFARFMQGISYCYLGSFFDQAYIVDETTDLESELALSPYQDVTAAGIGYLEDCIAVCEANEFTIPSVGWLNGLEISSDYLARVCHSYIARNLACVTRTPAERDAVDGSKVIALVDAGLLNDSEDFGASGDGFVSWFSDFRFISAYSPWTRADYKTIGKTDTSGNYANWLSLPVEQRTEFEIHTADRRITGAEGPQSQGLYFNYAGPSGFRPDRGTYHFSVYVSTRNFPYTQAGTQQFVTLAYREMQLLKAEYLYRSGDTGGAAAIVNSTREANGQLSALSGSESDFFEWLKYEKKIECFASPSLAYFDRRGWTGDDETGQTTDLVQGTPVHFPVPAIDLILGGLENYTHGGTTGDFAPRIVDRGAVPPYTPR